MNYLIKDLKTEYHIVYNEYADEAIRYSAMVLQKYLYKSTKCLIPVFSSRCERRTKEIQLGFEARSNSSNPSVISHLSLEGFKIMYKDGDILFLSKSPRGVLYSVYHFLNEAINLNCFDSETVYYDSLEKIGLPKEVEKDFLFEYRECYFTDAFTQTFASINMLNSNLSDLSTKYGGKTKWYNFHHSFSDLVPQKIYFDIHPEYYSLIDGVRRKEHAELCLSNKDVFDISLKQIKKWIKENPECKVISVAQDEWMGHFEKMACECKDCKEIDDMYQSQSGSIINFVNKICEALEDEYPDILIHTFAYQFSRKPPVGIKPHKNVIVRLCNIECSWATSIFDGALKDPNGSNAKFLEDLIGWSKITDRLYIWDYCVNYRNYLLPFPNLRSMTKNIELYKKYNVKGILMEGNFSSGGKGYLDELKSYVFSKLINVGYLGEEKALAYLDELVTFFTKHYYKEAHEEIKELIYLFEDNTIGKSLWLYDDSDSLIFNDQLVQKAIELISKAKEKVKNSDKLTIKHVKALELSVQYLYITRMDESIEKNKLIDDFNLDIRNLGITELFERTNLDYSIDVMRKSKYCKKRDNWYSLYYIMR